MAITKISVPLQSLLDRAESTYVTSQATAAATTLTVKNITGFAVDQVVLIGELGNEESEIAKTDDTTAPATTVITLLAAIVRTHAILTTVAVLPYDQIEYSHADTETGTKSVLATETISGNTEVDTYEDSTETTGYYFWRFKNSIGTTYSAYSDAIPYAGKSANSVGYAIDYALRRNNTERTDRITDDWLYEEVNSCLRYITGKRKKWAQLQSFDSILGQTARGLNYYSLPSDIYDTLSNRSILDVRVGTNTSLRYIDKKEWEAKMYGTVETDVRTEGAIAATTLEVDNSYDFADTGTVNVYISGIKYSPTYTGVTRSATAGVLTGVPASGDGSITATIPVDTRVWQGESEDNVQYFTVFGGKLWINPMPDASNDDMNVTIDYWTECDAVNSDGDTLDIKRFDMIKDWLTWSIRAVLKNEGKRVMSDPDKNLFDEKLVDYMRTTSTGQKFKNFPILNRIQP